MPRFVRIRWFTLAAAMGLCACSEPDQGVNQSQSGDPVISLSEGACPHDTCPVYDMTLHKDGSYILNGERYVKTTGLSRGDLGEEAWSNAETVLTEAKFWSMPALQTSARLDTCQPDTPTIRITFRNEQGKEKTLVYEAGCGVAETRDLVSRLRAALHFEALVWTNEKFRYNPATGQ